MNTNNKVPIEIEIKREKSSPISRLPIPITHNNAHLYGSKAPQTSSINFNQYSSSTFNQNSIQLVESEFENSNDKQFFNANNQQYQQQLAQQMQNNRVAQNVQNLSPIKPSFVK